MAGKRGGRREGAGRPKGSKDKTPFDIRQAALAKAAKAFKVLEDVASGSRVLPSTRVLAANSILDRAFGKPVQSTQMVGPDGEVVAPVVVQIVAATQEDVEAANAAAIGLIADDDDPEEKGD